MASTVKIPDNADEAAAMLRLAAHWLEAHAPEVLRGTLRATEYAKDAERYRKLRALHWTDNKLTVVHPGAVHLGYDTLSGDRLDAAVDALPAVGAA